MSEEQASAGEPEAAVEPQAAAAMPPKKRPTWLALIPAAIFWGATIGTRGLELPFFFRFLFTVVAPAIFLILFSIWWWRNGAVSRSERAWGFLLLLGSTFAVAPLLDRSLGLPTALMQGLPVAMTVATLWYVLARSAGDRPRRIGAIVAVGVAWASLAMLRSEGVDGDLKSDFRWRWSPTAEQQFLAARDAAPKFDNEPPTSPIVAGPNDWTGFRGPNRDGVVRGVRMGIDWKKTPPRARWKRRVGPAWSSMAVVGRFIYTQEQRGDNEAVVCYDSGKCEEQWVHEDPARFYEAVSGAGPRATPTFVDGRIYTLGATGILNCLDAATGKRLWTHDIVKEAGATIPLWGFSASPLVADGLVVVAVCGPNRNNLIAYKAEDGAPAWTAPAGDQSYASPQLATIDGARQVLFLGDIGLASFALASGKPLWTAGDAAPGAPRCLQPILLGDGRVFAATMGAMNAGLAQVAKNGEAWKVESRWSSTKVKAEFSEYVAYKDHAYGFDGAILCCVDLANGDRKWKGGRYGRGQLVLFEEQGVLLVLTEKGEVALVAAKPDRHEELYKFPAIEGKTWNHPVVAGGELFLRNAEEMGRWTLPRENGAAAPERRKGKKQ